MGAPRFVTVALKVGGANAAIDVTGDLISFSIEDTIQGKKADNLDIVLDDASKRYRNTWFIEKGTQVEATVTTHNWNAPGDSTSRSFGKMWVDTVEMQLKPSQVTFKATSISPTLEKGGNKHKAVEGQSVATQVKKVADDASLTYNDSVTSTEAVPHPKHKRDDQDNESDLQNAHRKAASEGSQVMVKDGKIIFFKETDLESKPAVLTFTDGATPIISGKFKTTSQGMYASGKCQHIDPKTGNLVTGEFTPPVPPTGTKAKANIREKPDHEGDDDDYKNEDPDPDPIGEGAPGSEGTTSAQVLSSGLGKVTTYVAGLDQQFGNLI